MYLDERIAEVYPIQRLPRRFSVFDYLLPHDVPICEGDLVTIPFREEVVYGVVKRVAEKRADRSRLKTIHARVPIRLRAEELAILEWVAHDAAQSVASVLYAAIPTPPKRALPEPAPISREPLKIRSSESTRVLRLFSSVQGSRRAFLQAADLRQMAAVVNAFLIARPDDRVAIFVPTVSDAEAIFPHLLSFGCELITGDQTEGRRFQAWQAFHSGKSRVLIGTRVASLLLPAPTDTVFVLRSGDDNHKQEDQNPRYDAREVAWAHANRNGSRLYFLDVAPRADDLARFTTANVFLELPVLHRPQIIDLHAERPAAHHPLVSDPTAQAINASLAAGRQALCVYNKKGVARQLRCADCACEFPCPTCGGRFTVYETTVRCHHCAAVQPIPLSCPSCRGARLLGEGFGNRAVQAALIARWPNARVSLIEQDTVEDPRPTAPQTDAAWRGSSGRASADILLVTQFYFDRVASPLSPPPFGVVAVLDADLPLFEPTFRSFEHAVRSLEELRGFAKRANAAFVVQSRSRELFERYYDDPLGFFRAELDLRRAYLQPPFARRMRLSVRGKDPRVARLELERIADTLRAVPGVVVSMSSRVMRVNDPCADATVPNAAVEAVLEELRRLPDHVIIDTNAIS